MGLIKGIAGKSRHIIKYGVSCRLLHTVRHSAGDKVGALPLHHIVLFLTHGTAHHIRLAVAIPGQCPKDLHDLLLVDDKAVGILQDRL